MTDPIFDDISKGSEVSLDFDSLRSHGIELVQNMAGKVWTDYNLHDPGVTILEALCYAITDLAYQTDFDITDLLSDEKGNIDYRANSFFTKQKILTSSPVTIADYRKAIIDDVDKIANVWLTPVTSANKGNAMRGLYKVEVQVNSKLAKQWVPGNANEKTIKTKVKQSFVSKRNLCEDIYGDVIILKPVEIAIKAEIQIESGIIPEELLAQIYNTLQNIINRPVKYATEREMRQRGYTIDQIYCGPVLTNGLIADSDLKDRQLSIDASDLIQKISNIDGVVLIRSLLISRNGSDDKPGKTVTLDETEFAFLNIDATALLDITLLVDKYRVSIRKSLFADILQNVIKAENRDFVKSLHKAELLTGTYRDSTTYYSLQNYFPLVYGIGEEGLLSSVPEERKAQAKQLKAYLMIFEQVLANYLAQLDNIGALFSNEVDKLDKSYFASPLYNVPRSNDIIAAYTNGDYLKTDDGWKQFQADGKNPYITALNSFLESDSIRDDRKNRMLDHLMARFNELGVTYPVTIYNILYLNSKKTSSITSELKWKSSILKDFDELNYNRSRGFNYLKANDEGYDYKKKMSKLLYILNDKNEALTSIFDPGKIKFETPENDTVTSSKPLADATDELDWDFEIKKIRLNKQEIAELKKDGLIAGAESKQSDSFVFMNQDISVLKYAININNYRIGPDGDKGTYMLLYKAPADEQWNIISRFADGVVPTITTIKKLVNYLINISIRSEGFYLIEHLLLRPDADEEVYGFNLYNSNNQVIFENGDWLTFDKREEILTQLLSFKPDTDFTIAQQNKSMAANNTAMLQDARSWNGDTDLIDDLVKKAEQFSKDAETILNNAALELDSATAENTYIAKRNNDIAGNNSDIASRNMDVVSQLDDITDKSKAASNIALSVNDKARARNEYRKAFNDYRSNIDNLLNAAYQMEKITEAQAAVTNKDLVGKLAGIGKMSNATGDDYADLKQLFSNIEAYGNKSYPRLRMLIKGNNDEAINEDFFSFTTSVIFPEWPARFQDKGFRTCVEGLFKYNTPVNIKTNIKWLSVEKVKQFEPLYSTWKQNMLTNGSNYGAHNIIAFLKENDDALNGQ
jgi:hypothetical protein